MSIAFHPPSLEWTSLENQITKKNCEHKDQVIILSVVKLDDVHL